MEEVTIPVTGKKLSIDFFYRAYAAEKDKELKLLVEQKQLKLDRIYELCAEKYTSIEELTAMIGDSIEDGKMKCSVFCYNEDGSIGLCYTDFIALFNEEYGKEKKPSLKSLLMGNLSDQFSLMTTTRTYKTYSGSYNEFDISVFWSDASILSDEQRSITKRKRVDEEDDRESKICK